MVKQRLVCTFVNATRPGVFLVSVFAKPGSRSSAFASSVQLADDALDIRIGAPPVEGKANEELVSFLETTITGAWRELQQTTPEVYFAGTSYSALLAAASQQSGGSTSESHRDDESGSACRITSKGKGSKGRRNAASIVPTVVDDAALPSRVSVLLVKGSTSRFKTVEISLPGTLEQLIGLLEKVSRN